MVSVLGLTEISNDGDAVVVGGAVVVRVVVGLVVVVVVRGVVVVRPPGTVKLLITMSNPVCASSNSVGDAAQIMLYKLPFFSIEASLTVVATGKMFSDLKMVS